MLGDRLDVCTSFLLEQITLRRQKKNDGDPFPFFLGLTGAQGIGKTALVSSLARALSQPPHELTTVVISIDDFYLSHKDQLELAQSHHTNPLIQHRGQPSTHDISLANQVINALRASVETKIPQYDKSAFQGQGDRVPSDQWATVNSKGDKVVQIVILEGWCLGFQALDEPMLRKKWEDAVAQYSPSGCYHGRLGCNRFEDIAYVNKALRDYNLITHQLDALIHLDAENLQDIYRWRLQQETALRKERGAGMTDEEVKRFVDGYFPSYELFTDRLRQGAFEYGEGRQLRVLIGADREIIEVSKL